MRLIRVALAVLMVVGAVEAASAASIPDSIKTAEKSHVEIYRKNAPAVVGLSCMGVVRSQTDAVRVRIAAGRACVAPPGGPPRDDQAPAARARMDG